MNPKFTAHIGKPARVPRASGDEPYPDTRKTEQLGEFPAQAGMNR